MSAKNVWFGNDSWPNGRSPGDFAREVFRIEGCKTDKEKAFAFYTWFQRCMLRGPNLYQPSGAGAYARVFDALSIFAWGSHECTGWGWVAAEALNAAGVKARRMVANANGHTFYEVWYKGDNGKEAWHAFDPFLGWYFLNKEGEVASTAELGADHNLVQDPLPGHSIPCGHDWMFIKLSRRSSVHDWLDVEQVIKNAQLGYDLQKGQTVSALWRPSKAENAVLTFNEAPPGERGRSHSRGAHCDVHQHNYEGRLKFPEHEPYWHPYRWPDTRDPHRLVRWHGGGYLKWTPLLYGAAVVEEAHNAVFENNLVRPAGNNTYAEVWYRIKVPYFFTHLHLDGRCMGSGEVGYSISTDNGKSVWPLNRGQAPFGGMMGNGQADYLAGRPSVQGLNEFLLRIDMLAGPSSEGLCVDALRILAGFHHNMQIQPRLLPGKNHLYLEAEELDKDETLTARWDYNLPEGQAETSLVLKENGRAGETVAVPVDKPEDIVMQGVTLKLE